MQILGYIVAAVALVSTIEAIPQFGHHGFGGMGGPMRGGPMRGGPMSGFGGHRGGFGGGSGFGGRGPQVSKTVITKTVIHG
ncbi:Hypothetical protein SRAE_1000224100 [Strongyloides ratti]|uniref:Uncharacterized protein n=1 Tax=Strongyloides ratti TaxID=34506 RepID=A0A090L8Y4_STRRB|nr:Hypothetical protein SRAE_1000224100 [Strongyloides ratti]CEF63985.1 Hypothetical protein SRAE_1000224100 [Strongyloides ratti]